MDVLKEKYDVVVVGAGIAGLMAANFLARGGKKTLVLEHNHQAGGCMNGIRRKGYYFDCGDQSFESMGVILPMLDELGLFKPEEWERADYRIMTDKFDAHATSFDDIEEAMVKGYPHDEKGIRSYFAEVREMSDVMGKMMSEGRVPFVKNDLAYNAKALMTQMREVFLKGEQKRYARWVQEPCREFSKRHFTDPKLLELFGDLAYSGSPAIFGTMFWHIWVNDYWYPRNGLQPFIDSLVENAKKLGAAVRFNRTVDEIMVKNGQVTGLRTHKGEVIETKQIVHCGDYRRLVTKMLPPGIYDGQFTDKIARAPMSEPLVSLYLGLNMSNSELAEYLDTHHTFFFPEKRKPAFGPEAENDMDFHKGSFLEITWTSKNNEALAPRGKSAMVLQTITNYRWNNFWGTGGDDLARPEEYQKAKDFVANQMIETLEKVIPGISSRVEYKELGSPQSTIRYTLNSEGASCSWRWDPKLAPFKAPRFRTPVRGLYTAGHYAWWPGGVPTAALSGKLVADGILRGLFSPAMDRIVHGVRKLRGQRAA